MWLIIIMTAVVVAVAIAAGTVPFVRRRGDGLASFPDAEAVTAGIFLGAGLIHMLGDAAAGFDAQGIKYPWPMLLAGAVLLALLWLEHAGHAVRGGASLAALATLMLSIHSFLAGAALGTSTNAAVATVVFFAIVAHKWAASFALSLTESDIATACHPARRLRRFRRAVSAWCRLRHHRHLRGARQSLADADIQCLGGGHLHLSRHPAWAPKWDAGRALLRVPLPFPRCPWLRRHGGRGHLDLKSADHRECKGLVSSCVDPRRGG
jgi:hypothetical protein